MLKKIIASVAAAVLVSGCASEPEPTPEENFVSEIERRSEIFQDADREDLIDAGNKVCDYFYEFGANVSSTLLLVDTLANSFGIKETAVIVAVAVENLCPEFEEPIQDALEGPASAT